MGDARFSGRILSKLLGSLAITLVTAPPLAQAATYVNGSLIDLATMRGVSITAGGPAATTPAQMQTALHPFYNTDLRWNNAYLGGPSWTVDLGGVFKINRYNIGHHSVINNVGFDFQTSLDGIGWTTQSTYNAALSGPNDGQTDKYATDTFTAVDARYARVLVSGHNGGQNATPDMTSWPQYILNRVQLFGPNNPEINGRISVSQSSWNGGSAELTSDNAYGTPTARNDVVDDFYHLSQFFPAGANPSTFVVTLNNAYGIDAVGISSLAGSGDTRQIRHGQIFLSPTTSLNDWVLVDDFTLPLDYLSGYTEQKVGWVPFDARRVRLDVLSTYGGSDAYVSELFVFVPEPASMSGLIVVGLGLVRRRRHAVTV